MLVERWGDTGHSKPQCRPVKLDNWPYRCDGTHRSNVVHFTDCCGCGLKDYRHIRAPTIATMRLSCARALLPQSRARLDLWRILDFLVICSRLSRSLLELRYGTVLAVKATKQSKGRAARRGVVSLPRRNAIFKRLQSYATLSEPPKLFRTNHRNDCLQEVWDRLLLGRKQGCNRFDVYWLPTHNASTCTRKPPCLYSGLSRRKSLRKYFRMHIMEEAFYGHWRR